jgi:hypothetical protein
MLVKRIYSDKSILFWTTSIGSIQVSLIIMGCPGVYSGWERQRAREKDIPWEIDTDTEIEVKKKQDKYINR